jgi:hypothetical protein
MFQWFDFTIRAFCWSMIISVIALMFIGCESGGVFPADKDSFATNVVTVEESDTSFDEGGTAPIIHLPFAAGHVTQCTQGANGDMSHHSTSTMFDIDFDTSNIKAEQLRAPVSGTAYVHTEDASKNFGYHVSIDLGNGTYVIVAHMSKVSIKNGTSVVRGQFIGYEGCTGYCSGDHVHIGLHMGDARKMGQFGTSIPVRYMLADKTAKTGPAAIQSTSLVCGIKSLGDPLNGHMYVSALPSMNARVDTTTNTSSSSRASEPSNKTPDPASSVQPTSSNDDVWTNDADLDGVHETLMVSTKRWANVFLSSKDAFVWGAGGCFDGVLLDADRVYPESGYYKIDFSKLGKACGGDFTLISAVGTDGGLPNADMTNWNWWQNTFLCSQGSPFCQLQKNGHVWEEWMIRVAWNSSTGLMASGNGYTKNSQLP